MKAVAFGLSDVGRRRDTNEDEFILDPRHGIYAVADGMGGHAAGEIASRLAIETLVEGMKRDQWSASSADQGEASHRLAEAVEAANRKICESVLDHKEQRGMGTTVVALLALQDRAVIGHVGDSRAYLLRDSTLTRLTNDHSWVNEQVRMGLMSDAVAQRHPMRNIVTRALGSKSDVAVDLTEQRIRPGDVFLLCSDGLNTMLTDDEIGALLSRHADDPKRACEALVAAANEKGGEDNTTVIVLKMR